MSFDKPIDETLWRFPRALCPTCEVIQPYKVTVWDYGDKGTYADLACTVCHSIIVVLSPPETQKDPPRPEGQGGC